MLFVLLVELELLGHELVCSLMLVRRREFVDGATKLTGGAMRVEEINSSNSKLATNWDGEECLINRLFVGFKQS